MERPPQAGVGAWLRGLDLGQYEAAFGDNDVDVDVLAQLTADDLKDLGVVSVGHRRRMLSAIASLRGQAAGAVPEVPFALSAVPERRQLTVVFCDLVESTLLASRLDPEELRAVIGRYQAAVALTAARHKGFVAKYMGDGVLLYFGYPHAHEEDAELAVATGLEVVAAVAAVPCPTPLAVRVGIATGLAIVGDLVGTGSAREYTVIGDTPNLAYRLQALARPNEVLIGEATRSQVGRLFETVDLGRHPLKGFLAPKRVWRVEGASDAVDRFRALRLGETPFLGRQPELQALTAAWSATREGSGRAVLLVGEAGMGKSRLVARFGEVLVHDPRPHRTLRFFCSPHHGGSTLHPIVSYLAEQAGFGPDEPPDARFARLRSVDFLAGMPDEELLAIADLAATSVHGPHAPSDVDPQVRRARTLEALWAQFARCARHEPTAVVVEDAQWADPTTIGLLDGLIERTSDLPLLTLVTCRPEFEQTWHSGREVERIELGRLSEEEGVRLVDHMLGPDRLGAGPVVAEIVRRGDGVPLFLEELSKAVGESVAAGTSSGAREAPRSGRGPDVPATLYASIMSRLDRLGQAARELAQAGAAIGRTFDFELLVAVEGRERADVEQDLSRLLATGLVLRNEATVRLSYRFKHALVQDVAYGAMLRGTREDLHERIAALIQEVMPWVCEQQPEVVGRHYGAAGAPAAAIPWWVRAGDLAMRRHACSEAAAHLGTAIELADRDEGPHLEPADRKRLQVSYGLALMAGSGYASERTREAFSIARSMHCPSDDPSDDVLVLYGLWACSYVRGDKPDMQALAGACLELASRLDRPLLKAVAHRLAGATAWLTGDLPEARTHLEASLSIVDRHGEAPPFRFGQSAEVAALYYLAFACWALGDVSRARELTDRALARAEGLGHVPSLIFAHLHQCCFEAMRQDPCRTLASAARLKDLGAFDNFPYWRAWGGFLHGWASFHAGDRERGAEEMARARDALVDLRVCVWTPLVAMARSQVTAATRSSEEALVTLDEAEADVERAGEHWFDAELLRQRAGYEMGRAVADPAAAEALLAQAMTLAETQHAETFRLRAAVDLASILAAGERYGDAEEVLRSALKDFERDPDLPEVRSGWDMLGAWSSRKRGDHGLSGTR